MRLFTYLSECYALSGDAAVFLSRWVVVTFMLAVRAYATLALIRLAHVASLEFYRWSRRRLAPGAAEGQPKPTPRGPAGPSAWGE